MIAYQKYIFILLSTSEMAAQCEETFHSTPEFGFVHSTFTSASFQTSKPNILAKNIDPTEVRKSGATELQYSFVIGIFLWLPLNDGVSYKPKAEIAFSSTCLTYNTKVYGTSVDFIFSNNFAIALKKPDDKGIIYMARDMSCYLTSKQPYVLIGPQLNMQKFDRGFINKGFQNQLAFGICLGYGINYEFHGTKFAPEISYSCNSTSQNTVNDSKKMIHKITLAVNFF